MMGRCLTLLLLLALLLLALSCKAQASASATPEVKPNDPHEEEGEELNYRYPSQHKKEEDAEEEEEDVDDEEEEDEEVSMQIEIYNRTEHQETLEATEVDFSDVDFSGDPATAAAKTVEALSADMLRNGRLEELFQKAKTPECRALIAKHFGYHLKALAVEQPLPFVSTRFESTCEDEQPWDFNNLPQGVHMGVSISFLAIICVSFYCLDSRP
jgi:hypothetical protein